MIDSLKDIFSNSRSSCATLLTVLGIIKKAKEKYSEELKDAYAVIISDVKTCDANQKIINFGRYVLNISQKYKESANKIEQEFIFSLKDYMEHYTISGKKVIHSISDVLSSIDKIWAKFKRSQSQVDELSKSLNEIYDRYIFMCQSRESVEYNDKLKQLESEYYNYKTIADVYNKTVTDCNNKIKERLTEFDSNEESRDNYITTILSKPEIASISCNTNVTVQPFAPKRQDIKFETVLPKQLNIQKYKECAHSLNNTLIQVVTKGSYSFTLQAMQELSHNIDIPIDIKAKLIESFAEKLSRECFVESMGIVKPIDSLNEAALKAIGEIINNFLNALFVYKDINCLMFYMVLEFSRKIYSKQNGIRHSLFDHIKDNGIWQDTERWKCMVQFLLEEKVAKHDAIYKAHNKGMINKITSKIKLWKSNDDISREENKKSTVFQYLRYLTRFMTSTCIPLNKAAEILMTSAYYYKLDQLQTSILLTEIKEGKKAIVTIKKQEKVYNFSDKYITLSKCAQKWLDFKAIMELAHSCKKLRNLLNPKIYKVLLSHKDISMEKRKEIWANILSTHTKQIDFQKFKAKLKENPSAINKASELIKVDIDRSYINFGNITKELYESKLTSVLQTYALLNPEVEYCQGMNLVVGFLINVYIDEERAFQLYYSLMQKYNMDSNYSHDVPQLHQFFYQLERLVCLFLPDLYLHLQYEGVEMSFFAAGWFLTLYIQCLQLDKSGIAPPILIKIWDLFLVDGWKAIFRTAIILLRSLESQLLEFKFEDFMIRIQERVNAFMRMEIISLEQFTSYYAATNVNTRLLKDLETDYKSILCLKTNKL